LRLAKYLAHCGIASRRKAEDIVRSGRVTVGGEVVTDPARDVTEADSVRVDGEGITLQAHEMWMVNKPLDVISTADEPGRRVAVVDLVPSQGRLYPVGRLDADSTGLILLTNDGELAQRLTHPKYGVPKTYRVELRSPIKGEAIERLETGVKLDDGPTAPAAIRKIGPTEIEVTISEGRNRQVRRMIEAVGNRVVGLRRVAFGSLRLGRLGVGKYRPLDEHEVARLWKDADDE
jgi:23S rRNA pseudouridine2605 synthase